MFTTVRKFNDFLVRTCDTCDLRSWKHQQSKGSEAFVFASLAAIYISLRTLKIAKCFRSFVLVKRQSLLVCEHILKRSCKLFQCAKSDSEGPTFAGWNGQVREASVSGLSLQHKSVLVIAVSLDHRLHINSIDPMLISFALQFLIVSAGCVDPLETALTSVWFLDSQKTLWTLEGCGGDEVEGYVAIWGQIRYPQETRSCRCGCGESDNKKQEISEIS